MRDNRKAVGLEFITSGSQRIMKALEFVQGENSPLKQQVEKERCGWNLYYDTLEAVEKALNIDDPFANDLKHQAEAIIRRCAVGSDKK